ncbi:MAG: glycerol kinase GlpK [Eubacteriales bacterium]|nr:glycerol kinase GlpK [Eubacteriales bacterium]
MAQYLAALDQGTTSSRAIVFTPEGRPKATAAFEFTQRYPRPGWVEHDPGDLISSQVKALKRAVSEAGIEAKDIRALGITNQRETTLVWERKSGKPVYNAIVWQCRRTAGYIDWLKEAGHAYFIRERSGLLPDAYFSASKIRWILDELKLQERAEAGELCFGTVDSFLAYNLLEGRPHVTDATNASRTMLFNLEKQDWDDDLLRLFGVPRAMLPEVKDTAGQFGVLCPDILGAPIPVTAMAGDQQAALFGQACFAPGDVKNTYGTGCFMLMNAGDMAPAPEGGLLATTAWRLNGQAMYALEGSVFTAGAAIQWLRDELGIIKDAAESQALAESVPDTQGVYLVPAFTGMGAPHWEMYARGTITGLTRGANKAHLARAALEAIAYQSNDLLRMMAATLGRRPQVMKVDGGATANDFLMQFQADIGDIRVLRPAVRETTALGAALLAGLGVKMFSSPQEAAARWQLEREFVPDMAPGTRKKLITCWERAVKTTLFDASGRREAPCS